MEERKAKKDKKQEMIIMFCLELLFSLLVKDYLTSNYINLVFYIIGVFFGNFLCFFISKFIFSIRK